MKKIVLKQLLIDTINGLRDEESDIILISLCTKDGFEIKSSLSEDLPMESDKIAAMSSTVCGLCSASSKLMFKSAFSTTIVETEHGNIFYISTTYLGFPCVLTIAVKSRLSLAIARYKTKRLAEDIANISED